MRLCFDLGLHVNTDPYVERGILSTQEAQVSASLALTTCTIHTDME